MKRCVDILVGLQWGSEAKGRFAAAMAGQYVAAVRSGGPNAGHTVYRDGVKYTSRSLPSTWMNDRCELLLGPGAVIDRATLGSEIRLIEAQSGLSIADRVVVDPRAAVIGHQHVEWEVKHLSHMGSTMHGVGAALMGKALRFEREILVEHFLERGRLMCGGVPVRVEPVAPKLHVYARNGAPVLLEGTQGTLLSIDFGTWPYCTARNVTSSALLADAGLPPSCVREVFGVMRSYPIRVGGESGPMAGLEISWEELRRRAAWPDLEVETTTVTGRPRRIATVDWPSIRYAVDLNGCTQVFVSFLDYLDAEVRGRRGLTYTPKVCAWIAQLEEILEQTGARVSGVSWGADQDQFTSWNKANADEVLRAHA